MWKSSDKPWKAFGRKIRLVHHSDSEAIANIYNHYVEHTIVSFEQVPITSIEMLKRIQKVLEFGRWIVVESEGKLIGYAYSDLWNNRCSYEKTHVVSIYLNHTITVQGIGKMLYQDLINDPKKNCYHTLIGGVSLPNAASVGLHEHFGFNQVDHYQQVVFKFDKWINLGYWQLFLDSN